MNLERKILCSFVISIFLYSGYIYDYIHSKSSAEMRSFNMAVENVLTMKSLLQLKTDMITHGIENIERVNDDLSQPILDITKDLLKYDAAHIKKYGALYFRYYEYDSVTHVEDGDDDIKYGNDLISRCEDNKDCTLNIARQSWVDNVIISEFNGSVFTMSSPIYFDGELIGDLSYDINFDSLLNTSVDYYYSSTVNNGITILHLSDRSEIKDNALSSFRVEVLDDRALIKIELYSGYWIYERFLALVVFFAICFLFFWGWDNHRSLGFEIIRSNTDYLTKVLNRKALDTQIAKPDIKDFLLVSIDGNKIKFINDNFGHAMGDKAIIKIANTLRETLRSNDLVYRTGGDEFIVLLKSCPESKGQELLDRINKKLAANPIVESTSISVSYGLAQVSEFSSFESALMHSDNEMYLHKSSNTK